MSKSTVIILCTLGFIGIVLIVVFDYPARATNPTILMPTLASSTLSITSSAFKETERIPTKYTCDGEEISIPLSFSGVPKEAKSLTLLFEDPDTSMGTFTHWVVFNIPPETKDVVEEMPKTSPTFGTAGKNGAGTTEYLGPCPPTGMHRYIFTLYALDLKLDLAAGASKEQVIAAMKGHVIAETKLMGTYGR